MPHTPTCVSCITLVLTSEGTIAYHPLPSPFTRIREDWEYDTKYDQLHSITLFSKHATAVRLVRGTFSRALIMGIILYH